MRMNLQRIIAVSVKQWREILRDRLSFCLAFVVPSMLMVLFGYGLSLDAENIPFAVVDHDGTAMSRDYADRFIRSRYFKFQGYAGREQDVDRLLARNMLRAAIIIPERFQQRLQQDRTVAVQTLIDGTFPDRSRAARGYVSAINASYSEELTTAAMARRGGTSMDTARRLMEPIRTEIRYLYNPSAKSITSMAPKVIMIVLMMTPPLLTVLGIVREKESGSIYNIYASSVTRLEFLIGKLCPCVAISAVNAVFLFVIARWVFGTPFKGDVSLFVIGTLLYLACTTGIGLVVSAFVRTQVAGMALTTVLTMLPAVLYSGAMIPVSSLSDDAQIQAHMLPGMYYTRIVDGTFLKGLGWPMLWDGILLLGIYAISLLGLGYLLFHKRPQT